MTKQEISQGVVHRVPDDLAAVLLDNDFLIATWENITPLARNEWICWIEDAKRIETRLGRIERLKSQMKDGKRRPCCWPGCPHREKNGKPS